MQQPVAILLNEREPQKKEISDALEAELKRDGITTSRFESSPKLGEQVLAAQPSVVIVDYILEDYGTGLDLLELCRTDKQLQRTDCIVLTDEPSLQVAIAAMKLGALDYLLTTDTHSFSECISLIKSSLARSIQSSEYQRAMTRWRQKKDLVLASEQMNLVFEGLQAEIKKENEAIVLLGEDGVGKRTLARILTKELGHLPLAINLENESAPLSDILARSLSTFETLGTPKFSALPVFENVSIHTAQKAAMFLTDLSAFADRMQDTPFPFFVTTSDPRVSELFQSSCKCFSTVVPSLDGERSTELGQLVQKFLFESATVFKKDLPKLSAKELKWFTEQKWSGNLSQLKRVIETYVAAEKQISGDSIAEKLDRILQMDALSNQSSHLLEELRKTPEALFETLVLTEGNLSESSRLLGCSVAELVAITQEYS